MYEGKIYVTGLGIVSALGVGKEETLSALRGKRSGIAPIRFLHTAHSELPAGEVKLTNETMMQMMGIPEEEPAIRTALTGMIAVREALQQARLSQHNHSRIALVSGTTVGGMDKTEQYYPDFLTNDSKNAYISMHNCGASTELIADRFDIFSRVATISTACSSAANAIMMGAELIRDGRTDIAVTGGSECLTKFHLNGFNTLMILDKQACRPFDRDRSGLNLGEGAAYLVLESEESLHRRNVQPLCLLSGYANTCDAFHQTASSPDGEGAYLAMMQALDMAQLHPSDIGYINAHGTGTPNNDLSEGIAVQRAFATGIPPVSSTKAFTGHATSAAGGLEAVISVLALQYDFIPVNLNFSSPMPELSFTPVVTDMPEQSLRHVLSNSFGFGGNESTVIFSAVPPISQNKNTIQ
ncbi:MAG: beta-ketoacyl-[acyl-carrier-protein] synthase family protein [Bacteroidales bacterium]|jgi:3-oxoacyl-[acyl-carrier-protein] synthase-1|nr:beta-ketoacyl-[acyl-carrier-protein] synthase family protein [Bacteroidales bacterium]